MSRVGVKGNIVIDRSIRKKLRIEPGAEALQSVENGRLVVDFLPPVERKSLFGCLRPKDASWLQTEEALNAAIEEAVQTGAAESNRP